MSLRIFTHVTIFISVAVVATPLAFADWGLDLSRRQKELRAKDYIVPKNDKKKKSLFDSVFGKPQSLQEIVILNTGSGFVPNTVRVREGQTYKVHVVNVNEKEKNVSFILDSFSEHHATYYGKIKSFMIQPKAEGVFRFQSPETSAQGKLVVSNPSGDNSPAPTTEEVLDLERLPTSE